MSKEAKNIITTICDEQCKLSDQLLPKHCAAVTAENARKKKNAKGGGKGKKERSIYLTICIYNLHVLNSESGLYLQATTTGLKAGPGPRATEKPGRT